VESLNGKLFPSVNKLVEYPFFRHYKVDLFKECPFWYENGFCTNRDCGVETADEASHRLESGYDYRADFDISPRSQKSGEREHCPKFEYPRLRIRFQAATFVNKISATSRMMPIKVG
jgi:hypothetical protein